MNIIDDLTLLEYQELEEVLEEHPELLDIEITEDDLLYLDDLYNGVILA